jgi:glycosyltransferase involved in cell wall biosynthesis
VTVAIPTYGNRPRFLSEAIVSVLGQTMEDIEVFVSNDGPTDEPASLVASFDDPRLKYVRQPIPTIHANLTHCLRLGTAPLVAICQDDDYWFPSNVERLIETMSRHPRVGVVHAAFHIVDRDGQVQRENVAWSGWTGDTIEPGNVFIRRSMSTVNAINMSSALLRRAAVEGDSFDTADDVLCDTGMWLRLARQWDVGYVGEPLTALRVHSDTVSVAEGINDESRRTTMYEVRLAQQVKQRFLAGYHIGDADLHELRDLARRWAQHELLNIVVRDTSPRRSPIATLSSLRQAIQIEVSLLRRMRTWRVLLASLVGSRGRLVARRLIGRHGSRPWAPIGQ